ncbi:hypothetical conserved protein [Candidatus Nitrosoglobus terrae]|uniref:Hypothetical conserved protein n=1 Tax=Candidatus Nitrosoglobus terrae TaxID=1630141 RepID=A0A1Q2SM62_9GAMM|nr:hypothetical protein [Candidatus Nitrosoglobus terrae]BAW80224.1 hypothetical conserved protein [Candidatus Nitrosoglobus terrae]
MTGIIIAVAIHVLAVIWWIGGLAFVSCSFLPALRQGAFGSQQDAFRAVERRFGLQARVAILLVGASGLYMVAIQHWWPLFGMAKFWWLSGMFAYWLLFMVMLFILGPSGVLKKIMKGSGGDEARAWQRMHHMHLVLLLIGIVIIIGGLMGNHSL